MTGNKVDIARRRVLFVNDNHCVFRDGLMAFEGSTFHRFLLGFTRINPVLSSPCLTFDGDKNEVRIIDGVRVRLRHGYGSAQQFYSALPQMLWRGCIDLYRHLRDVDAVVLVMPACFAPVTYFMARLRGKPVVAYIVGDVDEVVISGGKYKGWRGYFARAVAAWEAAFTRFVTRRCPSFVLGKRLYDKLLKAGARPRLAMTSLLREEQVIPAREQQPLKSIRLVSVGRLSAEKGFDVMLHCIARLAGEGWDVSYAIAGAGPMQDMLKSSVHELGIGARVRFLGRVPWEQVMRVFSEADVFVLPSLSEGVPKVVLEAMAAGIPVVATRVGGVPEIVGEDGERGWLVAPGDEDALLDAIRECATDIEARKHRVSAATEFAHAHTLEAEAANIESIILAGIG